jgi:EAL domain-containing protein (putative c-di-GMP-specific phosphodiesterase class I)
VDSLEQELVRSGLSSHLLAIDLPVQALATSAHRMEQVARALTDTGIGVIIDGVGATSGARLASLDAEAWKIDLGRPGYGRTGLHRSVGLAVEEAHKAGARAIAKAVEDEAQLALVRSLGFDEAFGNVVSPPLAGRAARDEFRPAPPRMRSLFGPAPSER